MCNYLINHSLERRNEKLDVMICAVYVSIGVCCTLRSRVSILVTGYSKLINVTFKHVGRFIRDSENQPIYFM